jgi:hypothetical protein
MHKISVGLSTLSWQVKYSNTQRDCGKRWLVKQLAGETVKTLKHIVCTWSIDLFQHRFGSEFDQVNPT